MAAALRGAFLRLRDSAIHGGAKELKATVGISYSQPDYNEFEDALTKILTREWVRVGDIGLKGVNTTLGITLTFDLNERLLPKGVIARRVTNVSDETRRRINNIIRQGIDNGSHPSVIAKTMRDTMTEWADLTKSRAYTIARTETAVAYNMGAILGYRQSGLVRQVTVIDGPNCGWLSHNDGDKANGKIVSLDEAMAHPTSHPNCVRAFAPVAAGLEQPGEAAPEDDLYANPRDFSEDTFGGVSGSPLEAWGHSVFATADGVTQEMYDALARYSGSGYTWMNDALRNGTELAEPGRSLTQALIGYLDKAATPDAVRAFRGTGSGSKYGFSRAFTDAETIAHAESLIGQTFEEAGFMSTALNKGGIGGRIRLELTIPKGYRALPVSGESTGQANFPPFDKSMAESELLLQKGARYVIESVAVKRSSFPQPFGISAPIDYVVLKGKILPR